MLVVLALYRWLAPEGVVRPSVPRLYVACALGNLSHVILDAFMHAYNPLFYPFTTESVNILLPMGDAWLGSVVIYPIVIVASIAILLWERGSEHGLLVKLLFDV